MLSLIMCIINLKFVILTESFVLRYSIHNTAYPRLAIQRFSIKISKSCTKYSLMTKLSQLVSQVSYVIATVINSHSCLIIPSVCMLRVHVRFFRITEILQN